MKDVILVVEGIPELRKQIEICLAEDYQVSIPRLTPASSARYNKLICSNI
jgi:hypothetical protein